MHITTLCIENFGLLKEQTVSDIPQFAVFYGENEAGKSSVAQFLRFMFCGVPHKKSHEYKEIPLPEKGISGSLHIQMHNSWETIVLQRSHYPRARNNTFSIVTTSGEKLSEELFSEMFGTSLQHSIFRHLYGISLTELSQIKKEDKEDDAVREKLYGASLGSMVSPTKFIKELEEKARELYTPRSSKAKVNVLLQEYQAIEQQIHTITQKADEYDALIQRKLAIQTQQNALKTKKAELVDRLSFLQTKIYMYEEWQNYDALKRSLIALPEYDMFSPTYYEQIKHLEELLTIKHQQEEKLHNTITKKEEQRRACAVHMAVIEQKNSIENVLADKNQYFTDLEHIQEYEYKLQDAIDRIDIDLQELGEEWTLERANAISFTLKRSQTIENLKKQLIQEDSSLQHTKKELSDAKTRLATLKQQYATQVRECFFEEIPSLENAFDTLTTIHSTKEKLTDAIYRQNEMIKHIRYLTAPEWEEEAMLNCDPNEQAVKELYSYAVQYDDSKRNYAQAEHKKNKITYTTEMLKEQIQSITDTVCQYTSCEGEIYTKESVAHEQQKIRNLEELIYEDYIQKNTLTVLNKKRLYLIIASLCGTAVILYFLAKVVPLFLLCSIGFVLIFATYFVLPRCIRSNTVYSASAHKKNKEAIIALQQYLALPDTTHSALEEAKTTLLKIQSLLEEIHKKQQDYKLEQEQLEIIQHKLDEEDTIQKSIEHRWDTMLQLLQLPPLYITKHSLDEFFTRKKRLDELLTELRHLEEQKTFQEHAKSSVERSLSTLQSIQFYIRKMGNADIAERMIKQILEHYKTIETEARSIEKDIERLQNHITTLENNIERNNTKAKAKQDWQTWLLEHGYPEDTTPEMLQEYDKHVQDIQNNHREKIQCAKHIEKLRTRTQYFIEELQRILSCFPETLQPNYTDMRDIIHYLKTLHETEQQQYTQQKTLEHTIISLNEQLEEIKHEITQNEARLHDLLQQTNATSPQAFYAKFADWEKYEKKREAIHDIQAKLLTYLRQSSIEDIEKFYEENTLEELEERATELANNLQEIDTTDAQYYQELGTIDEKIRVLETTDTSAAMLALTQCTTSIEKLMQEWYTLRALREIVLQTQRKFEEERQPVIMQLASTFMQTITQGKWQKVFRSHSDDSDYVLKVRNAHAVDRFTKDLSRGTQEQLYLALRLAGSCIDTQTKHAALPLILDDITVNFDKNRTQGILQVLHDIAMGGYHSHTTQPRQIFFFTCHEHVLRMIKNTLSNVQFFDITEGIIKHSSL